jgi:class 3 adenylate cyclase/DNA-binding response OmpR family regulator
MINPESINILLVDDTPINLRILSTILAKQGYKIRQALSGKLALMTIEKNAPDIILLDISMPEMDGYEVCSQIKANPITYEIPVIFISALDDTSAKVKAFEVGGADYITKPFKSQEVLARLENQLKIRQLQKQLTEQNFQLQKIAEREKLLGQISQRIRQSLDLTEILSTAVREVREFLQVDRVAIARLNLDKTLTIVQESVVDQELSILNLKITDRSFQEAYIQRSPDVQVISDIQQSSLPPALISFWSQFKAISHLVVPIFQQTVKISEENQQANLVNLKAYSLNSEVYGLLIADHCTQVRQWHPSEVDLLSQLSLQIGMAWQQGQLYEKLRYQQEKTETLLLNILPKLIAQRLKQNPGIIADSFESVTVMFADIVGFTNLSAQISPLELVKLLNQIFSRFDALAQRHKLEKIKTIGDAYMVVGGLSITNDRHLSAMADMALDMQQAIAQFQTPQGEPFQIRIGINCGPVVAGVIGSNKFIYDLWGDTVNVASRMESTGIPGYIQVTESIYEPLKNFYEFEPRGLTPVKGKGEMMTYWLKGRKT